MIPVMDVWGIDLWADENLAVRAKAVLTVMRQVLGISAGQAAQTEKLIDATVKARRARQKRDFAEIGAPFVKTDTPTAEQVGYRTFTEQFVRPHTLAHKASETGDPQGIAAAWWLAHHWWQSLNPAAQPRSADTDEDLADLVLALAVPMDTLPALIGEHLGGTDPVRPEDVRATLESLTWEMEGDRLVVTATCSHPAIDVAIREYFSRSVLPPGIPALDVRIRPTLDEEGRPSYLAPGAAFHMDEDRVRTLLMGEALYGEKDLAIRELYQNAVDATRHARARIEWLSRSVNPPIAGSPTPSSYPTPSSCQGQDLSPVRTPAAGDPDFVRMTTTLYSGHVHFTQGEEDGKEYIDCTDNGVGMGLEEITTVFSQAGMRSADLPEFVTELDDYEKADPPIELWTNSRFGIGALSYFMLAERVEVTTTRLNRDGSLGQTLTFSIDDPGAMFIITQAPQAANHGTTVRLWLREPGTSVATVLGSMLKVAPVDIRVDDPHLGTIEWKADQFNGACVPDLAHRVWWVSDNGCVLADGLETDRQVWMRGAYVDCRGHHAPTLSVDRKKILHYDADYVASTLAASVDTLVEVADRDQLEDIGSRVLAGIGGKPQWRAQDALSDALSRRDAVTGEVMGCTTNLAKSGFIDVGYSSKPWKNWIMSAICVGDPGRYSLVDAASWEPVVRPKPSDAGLLKHVPKNTDGDLPLNVLALACAAMDKHPSQAQSRYADLGFRFPDYRPDLRWDEAARRIFSDPNVLEYSEPVPEIAIVQLGLNLKLAAAEVVQILDEWEVPHEDMLLFADRMPTLTEQAFFLRYPDDFAKRSLYENWRWRCRGAELSPLNLRNISGYLGKGFKETARMARDLGFIAPTPRVDTWTSEFSSFNRFWNTKPTRWQLLNLAYSLKRPPCEVVELARDLGWDIDPAPPLAQAPDMGNLRIYPTTPGPLHRSAVLIAHQTSSTSIEDLIAGFEWAGFELVGPELDDIDAIDLSLTAIEDREDNTYYVRDVGQALNPYWVMLQSTRVQLSAAETLRRYLRLGYSVDHPELVIEPTPQLLMLASGTRALSVWTQFHEPGDTVLAADVLTTARRTRLSLDEILPMYAALGLSAQDPRVLLPVRRPGPYFGGEND